MQSIRRYRRAVLVLLGGFACAGITYLAFVLIIAQAMSSFFSNSCPSSKPASIESIGRFKLPPSAHNLWSSCWGLQGWWANARFELVPSDVDTLLASSLVEPPLSSTEISPEFDFPEIHLERISAFLYGKYEIPEFSQEILIDTSNSAQYTVYIRVLGG